MQAASRGSYQAAREQLESATVEVADEILAFASLLGREPRLRRALSDPSRSSQDRAGLVRSLFPGKVSEAGLKSLAALAGGRWSRPSELLEATERLGVD